MVWFRGTKDKLWWCVNQWLISTKKNLCWCFCNDIGVSGRKLSGWSNDMDCTLERQREDCKERCDLWLLYLLLHALIHFLVQYHDSFYLRLKFQASVHELFDLKEMINWSSTIWMLFFFLSVSALLHAQLFLDKITMKATTVFKNCEKCRWDGQAGAISCLSLPALMQAPPWMGMGPSLWYMRVYHNNFSMYKHNQNARTCESGWVGVGGVYCIDTHYC